MGNAVLTTAGAALIAQKQANSEILNIDQFVFADIPGLDTSLPPDPATGMPAPEHIVLQCDVQQNGLIDAQTVVYSKIIDAATGDFYINFMGLYASENEVLVAVCYTPRHLKYATNGQRLGNTLCKNIALQITDVSDLTGITVTAETWQWDFSAQITNIAAAAVAEHNEAENPHPGKFDPNGAADDALADHLEAANPHPQYLQSVPGKTITVYGVVSAGGAKLNGSDNWTVAKNGTGSYQLNITDAGNYLVMLGKAYPNATGSMWTAVHDSGTGIFQNNTSGNIIFQDRHEGDAGVDTEWAFFAVKL
ncbi:MAG: phage tail protein [Victivallaceae bacterium]|nr:phage tail protein [Victivallaceae bacterium]